MNDKIKSLRPGDTVLVHVKVGEVSPKDDGFWIMNGVSSFWIDSDDIVKVEERPIEIGDEFSEDPVLTVIAKLPDGTFAVSYKEGDEYKTETWTESELRGLPRYG